MVGEALPLLPPLTPRHWYFIVLNFEQLALVLKNRVCPESFPCIEYIFYIQDIWATCACPEKQSVPWICIEYIFFIIQNFEQLCAFPEKQSLPWKFSLHRNIFYHLEFWTTCACPEKESVPWIHCIEYIFFIIHTLEQLALALNSLHWYVLLFRILNNLHLPWIFQAGGDAAPPPRTPLLAQTLNNHFYYNAKVISDLALLLCSMVCCLCPCWTVVLHEFSININTWDLYDATLTDFNVCPK